MATALMESLSSVRSRWQMGRWRKVAARILQAGPELEKLTPDELRNRSSSLRYRAKCGEGLDQLLPEAFALTREAARRTMNMAHYEVQLIGGMIMHSGAVAEMQTGEGKTLTATLPLYLHALAGKGAHLATANDYLAFRDADWMRHIFEALGMTVGAITAKMSRDDRRAAYACDITYGTAREFGFDFLRDRLLLRQNAGATSWLFEDEEETSASPKRPNPVQRGLHFIVVDEADSLLIDEARIPLIISGVGGPDAARETACFRWGSEMAPQFTEEEHFTYDPVKKTVELTAVGRELSRSLPKPADMATVGLPRVYEFIERAIRVARDYLRDRQYVIRDGEVVIVDEFTGRMAEGRKWRDGIHQAVEAKEGLKVSVGTGTAAQITVQELFSQYAQIAGMTGTAVSSAREFRQVYNLRVVPVPTNRVCRRVQMADRVLPDAAGKWAAVLAEVREMHATGRPVLIGTRSIDKSEHLSQLLTAAEIEHRVLHARNLAAEAEIVAQAGQTGRVTVATNMAGRGTDIRLGAGVEGLGGLHVICTELHDSARIDRQLAGRCARQGDPGSVRQFLALDDEILAAGLGADRAKALANQVASDLQNTATLDRSAEDFRKAQRNIERKQLRDRKLLMHYAVQRKKLHLSLGQDPYLDAGDTG